MGYKQAPQRLCDAKICRAEAPTQNDLGRPEIRVKRADSIFLIDIASTSHAYRTRGFSSSTDGMADGVGRDPPTIVLRSSLRRLPGPTVGVQRHLIETGAGALIRHALTGRC